MKCLLKSEQPLTDDAAKAATGKTLKQWYVLLDDFGAREKGRRNSVGHMIYDLKVPEWWATTLAVEYEKQRGERKKDGLYEGYGICCTKTIAAPLPEVWAMWASSAALAQWFGPGVKAEVKDGGEFTTKDGDSGKYLRVREHKDLRFTWEHPGCFAPTLVDVTFTDKANGKTLVMANLSRIQNRGEADGMRAAWGAALDRQKALLEKK
jgi:uncharacterized protein YndB with AHSA1/START domain